MVHMRPQDLGWADVSFNRATPDPEVVTPNIQKLVDEGVHLTRHYVHQYVASSLACQAARAPKRTRLRLTH